MYHGIINIYKEPGYTSHDVVAKLRGILKQKKIGHTGTLDPAAEGVLPVCLGKGTKLCDMLTDKTKTYRAVMLLGTNTDTQDTTGETLEKRDTEYLTEQAVQEAAKSFLGRYDQIPPMYSALKIDGKKLYELAREGKEIERKARPVEIYALNIEQMDLPRVTMTVTCSKGTYIRTLCYDIGEKLGCCGCMEHLTRTQVGAFNMEESLTLRQVEELRDVEKLDDYIVPVERVFKDYPEIISDNDVLDKLLSNGNPFMEEHLGANLREGLNLRQEPSHNQESSPALEMRPNLTCPDGTHFCIYDSGRRFIGIYEYRQREKRWKPFKMFLGGE